MCIVPPRGGGNAILLVPVWLHAKYAAILTARLYNRIITVSIMARTKTTSTRGRSAKKSTKRDYVVRVTNVRTGSEQYLTMPDSARTRGYSLWPIYTMYVIGFGVMGLSFIAHTLNLITLFWLLLAASAIIVVGTAVRRSYRGHS